MTEVNVFGEVISPTKIEPFPPKVSNGHFKISVIIPAFNQEELVLRALDSIPKRTDIEIIVIDDGSTDNTYHNLKVYKHTHPKLNLEIYTNGENRGVAYTVNRGYGIAKGDYVVLLGSDDYFYTKEFIEIIPHLDGTDLVYFNLRVNDGSVWDLNNKSKKVLVGSVKFIRREFLGDTRCPEDKRATEDWFFYMNLLKKNPTEKFTHLVVKHYNHPREGSLTNLVSRGEL